MALVLYYLGGSKRLGSLPKVIQGHSAKPAFKPEYLIQSHYLLQCHAR